MPIIPIFTSSITKQGAVCTEDYGSVPLSVRDIQAWVPLTKPVGQLEHREVTDKLPNRKGRTFQKSVSNCHFASTDRML